MKSKRRLARRFSFQLTIAVSYHRSNMPAGPAAGGFAYFAIAKFIGYTAFCRWVIEPRLHEKSDLRSPASPFSPQPPESLQPVSAFQAGAARTVIGVVAGALAGLLFFSGIPGLNTEGNWGTYLFFALLVPVRIGEWWFLLWWMYRDFSLSSNSRGSLISYGIIASFALDAIGVLAALVLPGGIWIC